VNDEAIARFLLSGRPYRTTKQSSGGETQSSLRRNMAETAADYTAQQSRQPAQGRFGE
jgi:hypothetical protein